MTREISSQELGDKIRRFKAESGSHSPSYFTLVNAIPELKIKIDACFLSNPYATDLFLDYFNKEIIQTNKFRDLIEFYPSQNSVIANQLANYIQVPKANLFIGNGAIEIIQAVIHRFVKGKVLLNIPTFSSYYEFVLDPNDIVYNKLPKESDYLLDVDDFITKAKNEKVNNVFLINPNNPNGAYINIADIIRICEELKDISTIVVDESFIHFAYEDNSYALNSVATMVDKYPNLVIVKSMSKDFGIAGLRAGYGIMSAERVAALLGNGYLWNSSGLAEYFFNLYVREDFNSKYEVLRKQYIHITSDFLNSLKEIKGIKVYPSKANFALIELLGGMKSGDLTIELLAQHGIYTRDCNDKIGLDGEFIRVASRKVEENEVIVNAIAGLV